MGHHQGERLQGEGEMTRVFEVPRNTARTKVGLEAEMVWSAVSIEVGTACSEAWPLEYAK